MEKRARMGAMMYLKPYTPDSRKNELCETCRFCRLCNEQNKTHAPMLTACACTISLMERSATDLEQVNGAIVERRNEQRESRNFAYAVLLLERLFRGNILADMPNCGQELRKAVKQWLGAYYGQEYAERLNRHPNEKPLHEKSVTHPCMNALDGTVE